MKIHTLRAVAIDEARSRLVEEPNAHDLLNAISYLIIAYGIHSRPEVTASYKQLTQRMLDRNCLTAPWYKTIRAIVDHVKAVSADAGRLLTREEKQAWQQRKQARVAAAPSARPDPEADERP